jgi:hypothetical protein
MHNNQADSAPRSMSAGTVAGLVVAATIVIILLFGILWWKGCFGKKNSLERGDYKEIFLVSIIIKLFANMNYSSDTK